ncbi:MAG TPA: c-type cytochrome domain-containing protein, partial [Planctomycetaceae bacterium]|nr:c-type cytochrome domain-containing protein [Planctomycetaceae bacterium]
MKQWTPMIFLAACVLLTHCGSDHSAIEAEELQESEAFFENNIRPLLLDRCVRCHGPKKSESGLRLDSREAALRGGENGPAFVLQQPQSSLMIKAIRHQDGLEMPPDEQLNEREI